MALVAALGFSVRTRARRRAAAAASGVAHGADARLPVLREVAPFAFPNVDGRVIDAAALRGHVWIADFIFTRCTVACPIITAKMSVLRRAIPSADVRFVSFSVDPAYDTPEVLRAYAARWNADPRWLLLSPPTAEVLAFAKAMDVPFEHTTMPLEPILHTSLFFLVDRLGRVRGLYGSLDDAAVLRLVADAIMLDASPGPEATTDAERTNAERTNAERTNAERTNAERTSAERTNAERTNAERATQTGTSRGRVLFQTLGCAACHADSRTGPSLAGLAGRTVRLEGGATAVADAAYLRQSILAPSDQVVFGYNPLMPAYGVYLSGAEVDDLVAYLQAIPADAAAVGTPAAERAQAEADLDARDPVCGMQLKRGQAAAHTDYRGQTYYFCSERCRDRFARDAARYARPR